MVMRMKIMKEDDFFFFEHGSKLADNLVKVGRGKANYKTFCRHGFIQDGSQPVIQREVTAATFKQTPLSILCESLDNADSKSNQDGGKNKIKIP